MKLNLHFSPVQLQCFFLNQMLVVFVVLKCLTVCNVCLQRAVMCRQFKSGPFSKPFTKELFKTTVTEIKRKNYCVSSCFYERVSNQSGGRSVALSSKTSWYKVTKIKEVVVFWEQVAFKFSLFLSKLWRSIQSYYITWIWTL